MAGIAHTLNGGEVYYSSTERNQKGQVSKGMGCVEGSIRLKVKAEIGNSHWVMYLDYFASTRKGTVARRCERW